MWHEIVTLVGAGLKPALHRHAAVTRNAFDPAADPELAPQQPSILAEAARVNGRGNAPPPARRTT
jgi:hypothetical protein